MIVPDTTGSSSRVTRRLVPDRPRVRVSLHGRKNCENNGAKFQATPPPTAWLSVVLVVLLLECKRKRRTNALQPRWCVFFALDDPHTHPASALPTAIFGFGRKQDEGGGTKQLLKLIVRTTTKIHRFLSSTYVSQRSRRSGHTLTVHSCRLYYPVCRPPL